MSPITHLLGGWAVANAAALSRRERALVTWAGVVPDIDGLGAVAELFTRDSNHPLIWFTRFHHSLHTLLFAAAVAVAAFALSSQRWKTAALALVAFHLHLLCDLVGSRGPDGYSWPIPYLAPFSSAMQWSWQGQWALNSWQNIGFTCMLVALAIFIAIVKGRSPVELFSAGADRKVIAALRSRFGRIHIVKL